MMDVYASQQSNIADTEGTKLLYPCVRMRKL
jgi:hypothetical protein